MSHKQVSEGGKSFEQYRLYPQRYANTLIYILGMLQVSLMQNSFAPQAAELTTVYNESTLVYNLTSLIHMIVHVPVSFPANYIVDKYGTKVGNTIACVFCIIACWIRCLVNKSFLFAILGQFFVGCANPFLINAISKVPSNWFHPDQRAGVTGLLSFFSTVTGVVGLLLPGFYFSDYTAAGDTSENYSEGKSKMLNLLIFTGIIVTAISVLNLVCYRDKPPTPPSATADAPREDFKQSLKQLISSKTYILICLCFALVYGCFIDFAVVLGQLIKPFGFGSSSASGLSAICVISGILGSIIILKILEKTSKYKILAGFCIIGTLASVGLMLFLIQTESFILLMLSAISLGFFIIPIVPILLELANEVCYPIGEATVTGFIYTLAHVSSFGLGSLFSVLIDAAPDDNKKPGTTHVLLSFLGFFGVSLLTVFFMKQDLKRTRAESYDDTDNQSYEKLIQNKVSSTSSYECD